MPRYVIERDFGLVGEEDMEEVVARARAVEADEFQDVVWEHSHVCSAEDGAIKSFCVYSAPSGERLHEHAERVGRHTITSLYEIVGDLTPAGVRF